MVDYKVRQEFFIFSLPVVVTRRFGQGQAENVVTTDSDFRVKDIKVRVFDAAGAVDYRLRERDQLVFMMDDISTGLRYFSDAVDVFAFEDLDKFPEFVIPRNSRLRIVVSHTTLVNQVISPWANEYVDAVTYTPAGGFPLEYQQGVWDSNLRFPVEVRFHLIGEKIDAIDS